MHGRTRSEPDALTPSTDGQKNDAHNPAINHRDRRITSLASLLSTRLTINDDNKNSEDTIRPTHQSSTSSSEPTGTQQTEEIQQVTSRSKKFYELSPMLADNAILEPGKIYIKKEGDGLAYAVINPQGISNQGNISNADLDKAIGDKRNLSFFKIFNQEPLNISKLNSFLADILTITSNRGHTEAIRQSGRQNQKKDKPYLSHMYIIANGEDDMINAATTWQSYEPERRRVLVHNDNSEALKCIKPNEVLYIHGHTYTKEIDAEHDKSREIIGGNTKTKGLEVKYTAAGLAELLEQQGLDKEHRKLKIFCCYSSVMAKKLYAELYKQGFEKIELVTYRNEVTLNGRWTSKAAGITKKERQKLLGQCTDSYGNELPAVLPNLLFNDQHKTGRNCDIITPQTWENNLPIIQKNSNIHP